jgi:hypothetical protein
MLQILEKSRDAVTVQFTAKDLKDWYKEFGKSHVYFCHIVGRVVKDAGATKFPLYPDSMQVIGEMRELVPNRFKPPVLWSRTIDNNLKSNYLRGSRGTAESSVRCRTNLLKCIPDDHVFTWTLKN